MAAANPSTPLGARSRVLSASCRGCFTSLILPIYFFIIVIFFVTIPGAFAFISIKIAIYGS
jgi:hypothetical protein